MRVDRAELARRALEGYVHGPAAATEATEAALAATPDPVGVLLVEGISDQIAVETLATRRGRDLRAAGVAIVPMGGASGLRRVLERHVPPTARVVALCDLGERDLVARSIADSGRGIALFACDPDLESELIRAVGAVRVREVLDAQGDGRSFRTLQTQPEWRGRPVASQLRRFIGAGSRRKLRYARLLTDAAADLDRIPAVLDAALSSALDPGATGTTARARLMPG